MLRIKTYAISIVGFLLTVSIVQASGIFYYNTDTLTFLDSLTVNDQESGHLSNLGGNINWTSDSYLKYIVGEKKTFQINSGEAPNGKTLFKIFAGNSSDLTATDLLLGNPAGNSILFSVPTSSAPHLILRPSTTNGGLRIRRSADLTDFALLSVKDIARFGGSDNSAAFVGYNSNDHGLALFSTSGASKFLDEVQFKGAGTNSLTVGSKIKLNSVNLSSSSSSPTAASWLTAKDDAGSFSGHITAQNLFIDSNSAPTISREVVSRDWVINKQFIKKGPYNNSETNAQRWVTGGGTSGVDVGWLNVDGVSSVYNSTTRVLTLPPSRHSHIVKTLSYEGYDKISYGPGYLNCSSKRYRYQYFLPVGGSGNTIINAPINVTQATAYDSNFPNFNYWKYDSSVTNCQVTYSCPIVNGIQSYIILQRHSVWDDSNSWEALTTGTVSNKNISGSFYPNNNEEWAFQVQCAYLDTAIVDLDGTP